MTKEELKTEISVLLPATIFEEGAEWMTIQVDANDWLPSARLLKDSPNLSFDYLFCLTCIDFKTHLTMVYHLRSRNSRLNMVVKSKLDPEHPSIESVAGIWRTADFNEREVYEMFGVDFKHHPDLRLLILPDGWEGKNPLRKDFEDPVNMIKL